MIQIQDWKCDKKSWSWMKSTMAPCRWRYRSLESIRINIISMPIAPSTTFGWMRNIASRVVARLLMETAEKEAKKLGCKSVQLEYDKESGSFVLQWYQRLGYVVKAFGIGGPLFLVKKL